jgi:hypothetical protein
MRFFSDRSPRATESEVRARSPRQVLARTGVWPSGMVPGGRKPAEGIWEGICKRIRHAVKPFAGVQRSRHRACDGVAELHGRRASGA